MSDNNSNGFKQWAIVEIMGHQTYAGMVSEESIAGQAFVRIDVPESEARAAYTKFFGAQAIYCITPVSEETAKIALKAYAKSPVNEYELRRALPAPRGSDIDDDDDDDFDDEFDGEAY